MGGRPEGGRERLRAKQIEVDLSAFAPVILHTNYHKCPHPRQGEKFRNFPPFAQKFLALAFRKGADCSRLRAPHKIALSFLETFMLCLTYLANLLQPLFPVIRFVSSSEKVNFDMMSSSIK